VNNESWTVRKSTTVNTDYIGILRWTERHFGREQARIYARTLGTALLDLRGGPNIVGSHLCTDLANNIYTLHVARKGFAGRHFVVFRANDASRQIDVLRILHDSMDLKRHLH
jgi:toxin ParE1/3/4